MRRRTSCWAKVNPWGKRKGDSKTLRALRKSFRQTSWNRRFKSKESIWREWETGKTKGEIRTRKENQSSLRNGWSLRETILRKGMITCRASEVGKRWVPQNRLAIERRTRKRTTKGGREETNLAQAFSSTKISNLTKRRRQEARKTWLPRRRKNRKTETWRWKEKTWNDQIAKAPTFGWPWNWFKV